MDDTVQFLLEIGVEELPTSIMRAAFQELQQKMTKSLLENRLTYREIAIMGTPRRMVCLIRDVSGEQTPRVTEIKGPSKTAGVSEAGDFLPPALAFARAQNIDLQDLFVAPAGKGEYVFGRRWEIGRTTWDILITLIPETISSLVFPRSMVWGEGDFRFIRPIRWIMALLGDRVIEFDIAGVTSSRMTRGHRFLSPEPVAIDSVDHYFSVLEEKRVIVNPQIRRKRIEEALDREARSIGGHWLRDEELIEQVNFLVEYPDAVVCRFDEKYLKLPTRVLTTVMKHHQKYFACVDDLGRLIPFFLVVLNRSSRGARLVVRGNERVLRARLEDANFFFSEDRNKSLAERVEDLRGVLFQENLGTLWDKTQRIRGMSRLFASKLCFTDEKTALLDKVSVLAKADLTCEMVKEFPELQGYMGRAYLQLEGQPEELCMALEDQYLPEAGNGRFPETTIGSALSLADKIDTIVSSFSIGRIPTGSEDPGGLRRQAQGIISICLHESWFLSLRELINRNLALLSEQGFTVSSPDLVHSIEEFIVNRLRYFLLDNGYHYSLVNAVLATAGDDIADISRRIKALQEFYSQETDYLAEAVTGFTRANNISRQYASGCPIDKSLFQEPVEKELFADLQSFERVFSQKIMKGDYREAIISFRPVLLRLNRFFEEVLIMCEEQRIRENRLALMQSIVQTWKQFADLSQIVFPEGKK
ncbi:MAG TPA: glycine--tRNA ligase subunit beta [Atribacteraceae bacterium]|nr:glycine--tRNA ligase subunit beta [Atribacteraceae bacterium]